MSFPRITAALFAAAGVLALSAPGAMALTAKECSAKYKAAKSANTLAGKTWNDFRKAECGTDAAATAPEAKKEETKAATPPPAATKAVTAPSNAAFPSAVSTKYASETPGKARLHTCADQYKANKTTNANGGLKWIQKGGGYWSECNKKLKG